MASYERQLGFMTVENVATGASRSRMGAAGLDDILHGGLISDRLYLLEGTPGAGKTTLSLQFLLEGKRAGERCLYITLSETAEELRAGAASHGWTLEGIEIVELLAEEADLAAEQQLTMVNAWEVELSETTRKVLEAVNRTSPQRVVFDSLSELRLLAQNPLRYRRQILALKQFFVGRKCTVLLLDDKTADANEQLVQSIAHGVIQLERMNPAYGITRRRLQVSKYRGTDYRSGYHDYRIARGGLEVFPRLIAAEHSQADGLDQLPSGVVQLDSLLGGGPDRGTSTLLLGPAGSGKSTVAIQYASAAAARGEHAAIFAFDESHTTLTKRSQALGIRLEQGIGAGKVRVQQIDPAELSPGEFVHQIRDAVEIDGARVIVIDSLNGYLNAMPEEHFLILQLHELLTYLSRRGVTTFMVVAQHGMMGQSMSTPADTSYLADSVVLFRYFEHAGRVKKAVSVLKKRSGRHEEAIREMWFDSQGIHLGEPLTRLRGVLTGVPVEVTKDQEDHESGSHPKAAAQ